MSACQVSADVQLAEAISYYYADPLGYVMFAYPWGRPGPLESETGPDDNQKEFLSSLGSEVKSRRFDGITPVLPIQMAETSGHGTGKSVMGAWITNWISQTRPNSVGTVTAGTYKQLDERTWAAIQHWTKLSIAGHWFDIQSEGIYHKLFADTWKVQAQTSKEENAQSFAGQHARTSTSWYLFDEACHDDQTDVLARRGWLKFSDVLPTDELLTKDPETHVAEYVKPVAIHRSRRNGYMLNYERRGCNFSVTPNHKLFVRQKNKRTGGWRTRKLVEALTIRGKRSEYFMDRAVNWPARDAESFIIPGFRALLKNHKTRLVNGDDWFEFLGWYYSEGSLCKRINSKGKTEYVSVAITNRDLSEAESVMLRMGLRPKLYRSSTTQIQAHDRGLAEHLASFGVGCLVKHIPDYVMQASPRQINIFLDAYVKGDGYSPSKMRDVIYTSNPKLADQLQELAIKGGSSSVVSTRRLKGKRVFFDGHYATSSRDGFVISRSGSDLPIRVKAHEIERVPYDGEVFCAELPKHHLLYTRRNGTCMWSGNSEVPDKVFETAYGGLTDGEPMFFAWGQMVRNTGEFYRICFGDLAARWNHRRVDSRTSKFTNKALIAQWIQDYGETSDYVKVRVFGLPPSASELQYIDKARVDLAKMRVQTAMPDEPIIAGFDVSGGGKAWNVIRFRQGLNGNLADLKPIRIPGEHDPDRSQRVGICAELLRDQRPGRKIAAMFVDSAFGAVIVSRLRALGFTNVYEVNFGGASPDPHCLNMRAYMWAKCKEWIMLGALPKDENLCGQLSLPGYHINNSGKLVIESKADIQGRGEASPDDADSFVLTWAQPVAVPKKTVPQGPRRAVSAWG